MTKIFFDNKIEKLFLEYYYNNIPIIIRTKYFIINMKIILIENIEKFL